MALDVNYIYKFSLNLIRKNQSGGLSPDEFEKFWNDSQGSYQDDLLGRFQARNNGKEGANTGLIENETILQKLRPFISPYTLTITAGKADLPTDFIYRMALRIGGNDVYKINYNQRSSVINNIIDPPSATTGTYYFLEYEDYYEFLPSTATSAILDYIRTPKNVKWGFTYDADDRQVYNAGTSTQPEWDNNSCREITKRMLKDLGVSFKDGDFAAFGQSVIATGE